jgi:lycopene cyclase domain-containing protein
MPQLTYLAFHLLFVVPPLAALAVTATWRERPSLWPGVAVISVIAVAYTTPWDNYLIGRGVWWYAEDAVRWRIWRAPVEEYLFFVLQPVLTGVWLRHLPALGAPLRVDRALRAVSARARAVGAAAGLAVAVVGLVLVTQDATLYLGALLAWAGPVLAIQWAFGWPYLWRLRRTVALGVLPPALYLCAADRAALELGVWVLSERYTTGLTVAGLPVEEGAFFLLTTLFVVQGLLLFLWVVDRWR